MRRRGRAQRDARPRPLRQAQLLDGRSAERLANGFIGTQQKAPAQVDAHVEARPCHVAPGVLDPPPPPPPPERSSPAPTKTHARTHAQHGTGRASRSPNPSRVVCYVCFRHRAYSPRVPHFSTAGGLGARADDVRRGRVAATTAVSPTAKLRAHPCSVQPELPWASTMECSHHVRYSGGASHARKNRPLVPTDVGQAQSQVRAARGELQCSWSTAPIGWWFAAAASDGRAVEHRQCGVCPIRWAHRAASHHRMRSAEPTARAHPLDRHPRMPTHVHQRQSRS
jgi:hypothetical protein